MVRLLNALFFAQLSILSVLIISIDKFPISNTYVVFDLLDKIYSAALLSISMRLLRIEMRKVQSPEFFWRERLMTLHSVLFLSYIVTFALARSIETATLYFRHHGNYATECRSLIAD